MNILDYREAIEKQVPKKPRKTNSYRGLINKIYAYVCPTCGNACLERWMNERQETMYWSKITMVRFRLLKLK